MGQVLQFDQATWSTMRMVQDATKWCSERNNDGSRSGAIDEHQRVLKSLIQSVTNAA